MLNSVYNLITNTAVYKELLHDIKEKNTISVHDIAEGQYSFLLSALDFSEKRPILLICNTDIKASKIAKKLNSLSNTLCIYLPSRDKQFSRVAASQESTWDRLTALSEVVKNEQVIICTSIEAACDIQIPPSNLKKSLKALKISDVIAPLDLVDMLIKLGYERVEMVEGKGQCSLRGDILDIFSPNKNSAVRIEFFDDEIDTIRMFDCISQRSIKSIDSYEICPANECILNPNEFENAAKRFTDALNEEAILEDENILIQTDIISQDEFGTVANLERVKGTLLEEANRLKLGYPPEHSQTWLHLLYDKWTWIGDYLNNPIIVLADPSQLQSKQESTQRTYQNNFNDSLLNGLVFNKQKDLVIGYDDFFELATKTPSTKLLLSDLQRGLGKFKPESLIKFESLGIANYQSQIKLLIKDLSNYKQNNYTCLLFAGSYARANRLKKTLDEFKLSSKFFENEIITNEINILPISINSGFAWPNYKMVFIADGDIYGSSYKKVKKKIENSEKIASYTELFIGDYVVHETYGVGVYKGIKAISRNDSTQEYLIIEYAGTDILYVPTDQFDRVQKFASSESVQPHINKLGGTEWQNKKSKVKAGLKKLAFDLLALYAERQKKTGFAYSKDTPWQREFEDDFPYELTSDQENSLKDIYADMESNRNMDRLLCGDVGYGKTEVALRAAFKAVTDNKQVAILAPTTILVQQHYQTILKRFANFPINCDTISRFKTAKEQKQTLQKLSEGKIDIIVGTHRLLAKDVEFKNLGLLIVDEEQRFGVSHKELIKNLKKNIDVLTLTATPIPRTLYMSMIGVRDMSVLEMPPEDRLTVKTYVVEHNDTLIKDAITRELNRGGQVYFLYNKVGTIDKMYERLKALVPEARICIGHGQMRETLLESTMMDFYAGTYDILLCTTIIENGLDIPEANTIIVYDADKFGLSQLYQLRGRVGRSTRQAYAYFTIRPDYMLSEVAQKRLMAIREFTEFGAGYRIALRDLEIRGAGNIFGPEQSGHLATVGFDMYLKLVEQALNEAQGKPSTPDDVETRIDIALDSYLPKSYVKTEQQRIEIYKRIAMIQDRESRMDIEEELADRYGNLPQEVENLTLIAHLRACTRQLFISLVTIRGGILQLNVDVSKVENPLLFAEAIYSVDNRLTLNQNKPYALLFYAGNISIKQAVQQIIPLLENIINFIKNKNKENKLGDTNEN